MNTVKLSFWVSIISCITMMVGCARNDGKKTFEFLKAEHDILENAKTGLIQCSNPKPPTSPVFSTGVNRQERLTEIRNYHAALNAYWNAVIQNGQRAEPILNGAETKISGLDSAGVGEDAITLAKSYERLFGDQAQVIVEIEALAKLEQTKLRQNGQSKLFVSLFAGIIEKISPATLVLTLTKDVLSEKEHEIGQDQETQSHYARFQEAVVTLNRDIADVITKRSELVTSYRAKYPKFAWSELLPASVQTNTIKAK